MLPYHTLYHTQNIAVKLAGPLTCFAVQKNCLSPTVLRLSRMGGRSSKEPTAINGHGAPNVSETQDFLHEVTSTLHTEPIQSLCVANESELFSGGVDTVLLHYIIMLYSATV